MLIVEHRRHRSRLLMLGRGTKGSKSSKMEIYKMTYIHMDSHESETKLVHGNGLLGAFLNSYATKHSSNV